MTYTKDQIETILVCLAKTINISDALFQAANLEYKDLGEWISKKNADDSTDYKVYIYPQGSFALGTVIKPISDEDDYDLDLVCLIESETILSPKELKQDVIKPWIIGYKKTKNEIEEKRRCWHVEYEDVPNFHLDVIPAIPFSSTNRDNSSIYITDKDTERVPVYEYQISNPKGYIKWFFDRCRQTKNIRINGNIYNDNSTSQEDLSQNRYKTVLQKAVQILKRHRDIMFESDVDNKPISIIITTLGGQIYNGESSILDTLIAFVNGVEGYLNDHRKADGRFSILNPSCPSEDFADKWIEHPERQAAFFLWINQLKLDLDLNDMMQRDRIEMGNSIKKVFGAVSGTTVFRTIGIEESKAVRNGGIKVNTSTGNLTETGTITVPPSKHYGEV